MPRIIFNHQASPLEREVFFIENIRPKCYDINTYFPEKNMKMNRHALISLIITVVFFCLFFFSFFMHTHIAGDSGEPTFYLSLFFVLMFLLPLMIIYTIISLIVAAHNETFPEEPKKPKVKLDDIG